jgi:hypothetical protein
MAQCKVLLCTLIVDWLLPQTALQFTGVRARGKLDNFVYVKQDEMAALLQIIIVQGCDITPAHSVVSLVKMAKAD